MNYARIGHVAVGQSVAGGSTDGNGRCQYNLMGTENFLSGAWTRGPNMQEHRQYHTGTLLGLEYTIYRGFNGQLYRFGFF